MNRPLLITIGIVIISVVISVWIYLLIYGTPEEPRDVFTNFGFLTPLPQDVFEEVAPSQQQEGSASLALEGVLEQLTTRTVAGHTFVLADDSIRIRYAEMGTGHVYEINLTESTETQVSITTVPETAKAVFSPNGESVALIRYDQTAEFVTIGKIDSASKELLELSTLPSGAHNVAFRNDNTVYYTLQTDTHTVGRYYDIELMDSTEVFRVPVRDLLMRWGSGSNTFFAATRPTPHLSGALYVLQNGVLSSAGQSGKGLVGFANNSAIVTSYLEEGDYVSYSDSAVGKKKQPDVLIPEKCTFDAIAPTELWCGIPNAAVDGQYIDQWYKGNTVSTDSLWSVKLNDQTSRRVLDIAKETNREVDIINLVADSTGSYLAFINKRDQSLWLYRIGG